MTRLMKPEGDAFRLKVEHHGGRVEYLGPWGTIGTARGQRTRVLRDHERYSRYRYDRERNRIEVPAPVVKVEQTQTTWVEVPD